VDYRELSLASMGVAVALLSADPGLEVLRVIVHGGADHALWRQDAREIVFVRVENAQLAEGTRMKVDHLRNRVRLGVRRWRLVLWV
jgi:hypothetical protein